MLHLADIAEPAVRDDEVLVRVHATAVVVGGEGGPGRLLQGMDRGLRAAVLSPFLRWRRLVMLISLTKLADLDAVAELLADGAITPVIDRTFPLADTAGAMCRLATGEVHGKVVVTVAQG